MLVAASAPFPISPPAHWHSSSWIQKLLLITSITVKWASMIMSCDEWEGISLSGFHCLLISYAISWKRQFLDCCVCLLWCWLRLERQLQSVMHCTSSCLQKTFLSRNHSAPSPHIVSIVAPTGLIYLWPKFCPCPFLTWKVVQGWLLVVNECFSGRVKILCIYVTQKEVDLHNCVAVGSHTFKLNLAAHTVADPKNTKNDVLFWSAIRNMWTD